MSPQHDAIVSNASGAAVRQDLNNALAALITNSSGATSPATTYAYQFWADTTAGQLKIRDSANSAWIVLMELDGTMLMENGTAAAPGLSFASDVDTGFFRPAADELAIATGGAERVQVTDTETVVNFNLGVKEGTPLTDVHISADGPEIFLEETGAGKITGAEICCLTKFDDEFNIQTRTDAGVLVANDYQMLVNSSGATIHSFRIANSEKAHIDSAGLDVTGALDVSGAVTAASFSGDGASVTNVNATTLDSIDSGSFLRSDAADQKTSGTLKFNDNVLLTFGSSDDGRFYHTGSHQYLDLYTGDFIIRDSTTTKYVFDDTGYFRAYGKVEGETLVASSDANNAFIGTFNNFSGASTAYGLSVRAGSNTGGTLVSWRNGGNTAIGSIYFSGGTVTYGAFTAHHPCILPSADSANAYPYGTLLEIVEVLEDLENSEGEVTQAGIYYRVQKSQSSHSRKLLGAYGSRLEDPDAPADGNWHTAYCLGDGHILVNNSGGNIEVGDGIAASATPGIGQKATETPSMIIGIAQEAVTFANDTEEKLVAVQYGLQQFTPWS